MGARRIFARVEQLRRSIENKDSSLRFGLLMGRFILRVARTSICPTWPQTSCALADSRTGFRRDVYRRLVQLALRRSGNLPDLRAVRAIPPPPANHAHRKIRMGQSALARLRR